MLFFVFAFWQHPPMLGLLLESEFVLRLVSRKLLIGSLEMDNML